MAQSLSTIRNELDRIKASASSAQADVTRLKQELIDVLNLRARGGTPLPARIEEVASQMLAGQQVSSRARVGGGARLSPQHPYPAYTTEQYVGGLLTRYNKAQEELAYNKLKEAQLSKLEAEIAARQAAQENSINQQILTNLKNKAAAIERQARAEQQKASQGAIPPEIQLRRQFYGATAPTGGKGTPQRDPVTGKVYVGDRLIYDPGPGYAAFRTEFMGDEGLEEAAKAPRGKQPTPPVSMDELKAALGGQTDLNRLLQRAQSFGFGAGGVNIEDQIKKVRLFGQNYKQVIFEMTQGDRIVKELTLTMDRHGNIMESTQKAYRTFLGSIQRNTAEMIKWSAAALLVWGTIRKLQELLQTAIKIQSELANVGVSLGQSGEALNKVFFTSADAAKEAGEAIEGVIKSYAQAYRSTGSIENVTERARVTQLLLRDALVLSRLSSLDQASAMDTLTGALRQANLPLDQGVTLLDKWVAISRVAGVGLDTLAEGFAITGTAAEGAGLNYNELAATLATMSEITTLSSREAGNAVRAFITGFTTDSAKRELESFGISIEDINGNTRGFLEILNQVADLFQQGIISKDQLNAIALAWGGGVRRGAQIAALIQNRDRIKELSEVTAQEGEAQKALGIQLDTVETSLTRLSNAFQVLAKSMGTEGGVLNIVTVLVDSLTELVELTASLTRNLGSLTPALAGIATLMLITSQETRSSVFAKLGYNLATTQNPLLTRGFLTSRMFGERGLATRGAQSLAAPGGFNTALAGGFVGFAAIQAASQGNWKGVGGAIAGGISGYLIGGPFGAIIGSSIGEAFVNATFGYKGEFENFFTDIFGKATEGGKGGVTDEEAITNKILGTAPGGPFVQTILAAFSNAAYAAGRQLPFISDLGAKAFGVPSLRGAPPASITPEQVALMGVPAELRQEVFALQERQRAGRGRGASIVKEESDAIREYGTFIDEVIKKEQERARAAGLAGEVTEKQLRDILNVLPKLPASIIQYERTFGNALRTLNSGLADTKTTYVDFIETLAVSSPEQISNLNAISNEIDRLTGLLESAKAAGEDTVVISEDNADTIDVNEEKLLTLEETQARINELALQGATNYTAMSKAIDISKLALPSITTLDIQPQDLQKVLDRATQLQSTYIAETFKQGLNEGLSETDIRGTFEPIMIQAGEDGGFYYAEGFMSQFISTAVEQMKESGEILGAASQMGLQQFDIPSTQFPQVFARYQQLASSIQGQLAAQGVEWTPNEETFAGLFTDFIAQPITADLTLLNIAMQELIDVNKKELDGIYNLPTDASFYVPFTGYQMGFVNRGGGGGGGGLPAIPPAATLASPYDAGEELLRRKIEGDKNRATRSVPDTNILSLLNRDINGPSRLERLSSIKEAFPPDFMDALSNIETNLNIEATTTVTLVVDGQTLANVVKPYFLADTLRYEGAGGGVTKRYVM